MNWNNLSKNVKITPAISPSDGAAGTTDINGYAIDMAGFDGVMMVVIFGAITSSAVTSIKAQQDTSSAMSSAADLEGTGQTIADTDDNKTFYIDLYQPTERYVRLVVDRGTANAVVASATYFQYVNKKGTVSHGTNVSGEFHQSPDEGTA